jgi:hypothetical protein
MDPSKIELPSPNVHINGSTNCMVVSCSPVNKTNLSVSIKHKINASKNAAMTRIFFFHIRKL